MGDIVIHNKSNRTSDNQIVAAEERADFLITNGYPLPTDDYDELVALIAAQMEKERKENDDPTVPTSLRPTV